jgi:hypothetical protein
MVREELKDSQSVYHYALNSIDSAYAPRDKPLNYTVHHDGTSHHNMSNSASSSRLRGQLPPFDESFIPSSSNLRDKHATLSTFIRGEEFDGEAGEDPMLLDNIDNE